MSAFEILIELFAKFPGVGPRAARRMVYYLLHRNPNFAHDLSTALSELHQEMHQCNSCYRYYAKRKDQSEQTCSICENPNTVSQSLMVVEKDVDLENVHKAGLHDGRFFVLGGLLPILEKAPETRIRIRELLKLVNDLEDLNEIILALSANPVGDHTIDYLTEELTPLAEQRGIKLTLLGRGLSTGTELEYIDAGTLEHALRNRS